MSYARRKEFLIFGSPRIEEDSIADVVDSLRSGWIGTGPKVRRFQDQVAEYTGTKHARALNSCTAALHLCLLAVGVKPGDEVIMSPLTFGATANTVVHCGGIPVFVDCERASMNIDPALIEAAITPRTRAIVTVDMAGLPCDMDVINAIAKKHSLPVIADAAHSLGGSYKGVKVGKLADLTCFSFYVTKNIVTGEGGMVTTDNDEWAEQIEVMGLHGLSRGAWQRYSDKGFKHYEIVAPGYKYNMMDLQAAIGFHQMKRIDEWQARREVIWHQFDEAFKDLPVFLPAPVPKHKVHARHLYTPLLDIQKLDCSRDELLGDLRVENIGGGIHFVSLHLHAYYRERFGFSKQDYPNAGWISERTLSLPFSAKLTDLDVADVIGAFRHVVTKHTR